MLRLFFAGGGGYPCYKNLATIFFFCRSNMEAMFLFFQVCSAGKMKITIVTELRPEQLRTLCTHLRLSNETVFVRSFDDLGNCDDGRDPDSLVICIITCAACRNFCSCQVNAREKFAEILTCDRIIDPILCHFLCGRGEANVTPGSNARQHGVADLRNTAWGYRPESLQDLLDSVAFIHSIQSVIGDPGSAYPKLN